jgi:hypothetical protein
MVQSIPTHISGANDVFMLFPNHLNTLKLAELTSALLSHSLGCQARIYISGSFS